MQCDAQATSILIENEDYFSNSHAFLFYVAMEMQGVALI